ncbi:MAG: ABC transporter permease [Lachnospiraceae bacterium]
MMEKIQKYQFLFSELVKRDFKQKYKRTSLGMLWSILSPLLNLLVMRMVFTVFFAKDMEHYTTYLFSGLLVFNYFCESTKGGMSSLMSNAKIFTKVNVPKYLFLLSKNVSALINFGLTLVIYFLFCLIDGVSFGPHMLTLIFPIICMVIFNIGVGMVLSAMFVFFRDVQYLYDVFITLLRYLSAIFYTVDRFGSYQNFFMMNPVYAYIRYFRLVVLEHTIPSLNYHLLCLCYAAVMLGIGCWIYKKYNHQFLYYV